MTKHKKPLFITLFVFAFVIPWVAAAPQGNDVNGSVTSAGSSNPISGVLVTLSSGPIDPLSTRALQISTRQAGINFSPSTEQGEELMFQSLTNAALSAGISPGNADLATALHNFREQTAKFKAITGNDGRFTIRDVPPGPYTVRAERDGFFGARNAAATIVVPGTGAPVALSLIPGATIGGRIKDDDGELLPNATVQALVVTYMNGYPTLSTAVTAKTDFRGEYRLFWMKAGDYIIAATRDGIPDLGARTFYPGTPELKGATTVALKTGENLEGADFTISNARLAKISGEIISQGPPPNLTRELAGLPPGVQLPPDFAPPVELYVGLRDPNVPETASNSLVATVVLEGSRGRFEFIAPPGRYDLYARMFSGGAARIPIDVGNQDIPGVTINLQPPRPLKGTINTNGGTADLGKLRLSISSADKSPEGGFIRDIVLPDGSFASTVPADGQYRIGIDALPSGTYIADVRQNGASVFDTGFTASADTPPVEIILGSGLGTLKGIVQDSAGKPLPNAVVSVIPPEARRKNRTIYRTATSNGSGQFTIQGIIPGNYKLFAWQAIPNGSFFSPQFLARYEDKGKPINVEAGNNSEMNLTPANEP